MHLTSWGGLLLKSSFLISVFTGCNFDHPKANPTPEASGSDVALASYQRIQTDLLNKQCAGCHNPGRSAGGVDLTSFGPVTKGRTSDGAALVVPGQSASSALYTVIRDGIMPPRGAVSKETLDFLACWIDQGARESGDDCKWEGSPPIATLAPQPASTIEQPTTPQPETTTPPAPVGPSIADGAPPSLSIPPTPLPSEPVLQPSYPLIVSKILTPSCIGCHNDRRASGGVNLSSFQKITASKLSDGLPILVPGKADESPIYRTIAGGIMPPRGAPITQDLQNLLRCWIDAGASETLGDACSEGVQ